MNSDTEASPSEKTHCRVLPFRQKGRFTRLWQAMGLKPALGLEAPAFLRRRGLDQFGLFDLVTLGVVHQCSQFGHIDRLSQLQF